MLACEDIILLLLDDESVEDIEEVPEDGGCMLVFESEDKMLLKLEEDDG